MENRKKLHSGTLNAQPSDRELAHKRLARELAAEGMVLLKNEGVLPLAASVPIALLGAGAAQTVKGGTGSGDVNNRESISIYEGLKAAGAVITSESWLKDYRERYEKARILWKQQILEDVKRVENPFDAYAAHSFSLPEGRRITEGDLKHAGAAVYVISRISGEGRDRRREEGDYDLSKKEREDLFYLDESGLPVILILNVGAPMELSGLLERTQNIRAILLISLPGQEGGHGVADVLLGRAMPGGRLTATWARHYEDYPSSQDFGYLNGNLETEEYREGIYVGYRYFDSFGIEPLFPFGYGLSYTEFSIEFEELQRKERSVEIGIRVKNTGEYYPGREVVQVYATLPQTGMAKEYQRLVGFAKTGVLQPGEEQKLMVSLEHRQLASYSQKLHAWVIEAGTYGVWIGRHGHSLQIVALLTVREQVLVEQTNTICPKLAAFDDPAPARYAKERAGEWMRMAKALEVPRFSLTPKKEPAKPAVSPMQLAEEQTISELIPLLYGNITQDTSMLGSAGIRVPGSAGETTEALEESYGILSLVMADGPAGLRLRQSYEVDRESDRVYGAGVLGSLENGFLEELKHHENADVYYQYCTAFPVGTALAQTWDLGLMEKFGRAIAVEMEEFHVDLWLAPGMNIQRNPLCGRNFEYYSEDPLLCGLLAAAVTKGVQSHKGCGVTVKHLACNNQEDNRMNVDVCVSERALREIYLRGFEIAVKRSMPAAIMSAYNRINGVHAANSRDLCMTVVREEWGFEGIIISDWNTTVPESGSVPWECIAAGNDIIMPGNWEDDKNIREAYAQGRLSEKMIRSCGGRILRSIQRLRG